MKAVILAGGMGTRGRPYTDYFPKAMTPIEGKPLIDHIVGFVCKFDFIDGIIVIGDFAGIGGQIKHYYQDHDSNISFIQDSGSGTGGDLLYAEKIMGDQSDFLLWFADNLGAINLEGMRETFLAKDSTACVATRNKRREETGFAVVKDGIIQKFREKPTVRLAMSECLGIYMLQKNIIRRIRSVKKKNVNLSYDVLQPLSSEGRISAFDIGDADWIDVQSPTMLDRNKRTVKKITRQMESPTFVQTR